LKRGKLVLMVAVVLTAVGVWELGHGLWIHAKAELAQYLLQRAWERTLRGEAGATPWPWADTWPVARLRVPAHGVDLIVLTGVSGRTLAFGPGYAPESAVLGASGTAIVTAHRDTHFRFLERVRPGDEIVVELPGRSRALQGRGAGGGGCTVRDDPCGSSLARARADDLLSVRRARARRPAALRGDRARGRRTRAGVHRRARDIKQHQLGGDETLE